jgi:sterol desaturase/sphingolipid hydroxylase (fatty acid hydroxylase superfamily)
MSAPISLELIVGLLMFAVVFAPLERLFPTKHQPALRSGWRTDVVYYAAGCFVGHLSDAICLGSLLILRHATGLGFGYFAAHQPGWLQFLEIILLADFLAYWFHRALHRTPVLWRLHRVHHTSEHMDWLANVRLHPIDKVLGDCFQFIPIFLLGFANGPMFAYTLVLAFQGFLNHSNVRVNYGPLRWVIASPAFHHWHHSNDPNFHDRNFAPHFVFCDLLFGTAFIPKFPAEPETFGVTDRLPQDFVGQMISPFRRTPPVEG